MPHPSIILLPFLLVVSASLVSAEVTQEPLTYQSQGVSFSCSVVHPAAQAGPAPGVLVMPEWWGLNDYARRRAHELAELGYVALAVDMYGNGTTTTDPAKAGALAGPLLKDRAQMRARAHAALEQLLKQPGVDPHRLGAIGFCFGGSVVLELARAGEPLAGVVSFHGGLATSMPATLASVTAHILVLAGGADPHVPPKDIAGFIDEMTAAKASWRMDVYGGAMHAFTNPAANAPAMGLLYDADAERRSMAAMRAFFSERFAPSAPPAVAVPVRTAP